MKKNRLFLHKLAFLFFIILIFVKILYPNELEIVYADNFITKIQKNSNLKTDQNNKNKDIHCYLLSSYMKKNLPFGEIFLDENYEKKVQNKNNFKKKKRKKFLFIENNENDEEIINLSLPYHSKLAISGRKAIAFEYGKIDYKNSDEIYHKALQTDIKDGLNMRQEMQLRVDGKVGKKIYVNINYDDQNEIDKKNMSILYKGYKKGDLISYEGEEEVYAEKDEIVEELAFGDIMLELPQTEFIGYKRILFGLRLKAKYDKFNILAIGSQTEGIVEKKEFKGNTQEEHVIINEKDYIKRTYYKMYFSDKQKTSDFPIQKGSEEIYIFDQSSVISGYNVFEKEFERYGGGLDGKYLLKKLKSGVDYELDLNEGVVKFKTTIASNYVIAIDYIKKNGEKLSSDNGKLKLIKDENNNYAVDNEIKWYYDLGNTNIVRGTLGEDLIFRVIDANESILNNFNYNSIDIDYYNGILKFKREEPFSSLNPDIYITESANSIYKIEVQYFFERSSNATYVIGKTIVEGSESITLDGIKLIKDEDYIIDYDIGFITLTENSLIKSDSILEITYEYLPYGGQYKQTLLGGRVEYKINEDNYLGVSGLYSTAQKPEEVPSVYGPPKSVMLLDSDLNVKLKKETTKLPFDVSIKGEIAKSFQNANIFGKALVDNMEGSTITDSPTMNKDYWQIASNPNEKPLKDLSKYSLFNEDIDFRTINKKINSDEEKKVETLGIKINNLEPGEQASIVYNINSIGADYSEKSFLEGWIYVDEALYKSNATLIIRYGGIDEDVDKRGGFDASISRCNIGSPKTEDFNQNGVLNIGEDVGWSYYPEGAARPIIIGAGNGRLDTTDLNQNGLLDKDDGYGGEFRTLIDEAGNSHETLNFNSDAIGWKKIIIPLNINSSNKFLWEKIKNLRITISNENSFGNINGNIKFYGLGVSGNKWTEIEKVSNKDFTFQIKTVDKETDENYISISDAMETKSLYKDLYGKNINLEEVVEKALLMEYKDFPPLAEAFTSQTFAYSKKYDFSSYKKIKFFLYGDGNNEEFFIDFGADKSNYFEYVKKIDWKGHWKVLEIDLEDNYNNALLGGKSDGIPDGFSSYKGTPRLDNIKYIRMGLRNSKGSEILIGKVYINDIFLEGVKEKRGMAYMGEVLLDLPKNIQIIGKYKHIGSDFESITTGSQSDDIISMNSITSGRELTEFNGKVNINTFKFFKTSLEVNQEEKITPQNFLGVFDILEEGKIKTNSKILTSSFQKEKLPKITFMYYKGEGKFYDLNMSTETVDIYSIKEFQKKDIYKVSTDYEIPIKAKNFKQKIYFDYKKEKLFSDVFNQEIGKEKVYDDYDITQVSDEYTVGTSIKLFNRFNFNPKYVILDNSEDIESRGFYPTKKQNNIILDTSFEILKWLRPNFAYNISKKEDYNIDYTNIRNSTYTLKDIYLENKEEVYLDFYMKEMLPKFKYTRSLYFNVKYETKDINAWDDIEGEYSFSNKWFTRNMGLENLIMKGTFENGKQISLSKQDVLSCSMEYKPFDFINDNKLWKKSLKSINTKTLYQSTKTNDLSNDISTTILPEMLLEMKEIENLFYLNKFIKKGEFITQILKKEEYSDFVYDKITNNFDIKYRFSFLEKLDFSLNYHFENYDEYDLDNNNVKEKIKDIDISNKYIQIAFDWKKFRIATRYEYNTEVESLINSDDNYKKEKIFSVKFDTDLNMNKALKIPFLKKFIKLNNRLKFSTELKDLMERNSVLEDNRNTYSIITNSEYFIDNNINVRFGLQYYLVDYIYVKQSNYNALQLLTEISIIF